MLPSYYSIQKIASRIRPPSRFRLTTIYAWFVAIATALFSSLLIHTTSLTQDSPDNQRTIFVATVGITSAIVIILRGFAKNPAGWMFTISELLTMVCVGAVASEVKLWGFATVILSLICWMIVVGLRSFVRTVASPLTLPFLVILLISGVLVMDNARAGYVPNVTPNGLLVFWVVIELLWILFDQRVIIPFISGKVGSSQQ